MIIINLSGSSQVACFTRITYTDVWSSSSIRKFFNKKKALDVTWKKPTAIEPEVVPLVKRLRGPRKDSLTKRQANGKGWMIHKRSQQWEYSRKGAGSQNSSFGRGSSKRSLKNPLDLAAMSFHCWGEMGHRQCCGGGGEEANWRGTSGRRRWGRKTSDSRMFYCTS